MKLSTKQIQVLAEKVLNQWKKQNIISFKVDEKKVLEKIIQVITADYQREADLDREVNVMLDQLERQHSGEFQRFKMYPILKQKLAKEKKVIL